MFKTYFWLYLELPKTDRVSVFFCYWWRFRESKYIERKTLYPKTRLGHKSALGGRTRLGRLKGAWICSLSIDHLRERGCMREIYPLYIARKWSDYELHIRGKNGMYFKLIYSNHLFRKLINLKYFELNHQGLIHTTYRTFKWTLTVHCSCNFSLSFQNLYDLYGLLHAKPVKLPDKLLVHFNVNCRNNYCLYMLLRTVITALDFFNQKLKNLGKQHPLDTRMYILK